MMKLNGGLWLVAAFLCLVALVAPAVAAEDLRSKLTVRNDSAESLKCVIIFGHWVTIDVPVIPAGQAADVTMMRAAKDGALYMPRFDGRRMMIERIACGRVDQWWESLGDIPLLALHETAEAQMETVCTLAQRAICAPPHPSSVKH